MFFVLITGPLPCYLHAPEKLAPLRSLAAPVTPYPETNV